MAYIEQTVIAGEVIEKRKYHTFQHPKGGHRAKNSEPSPERIKKSNMRRRGDRLRWLMNANFNDRDFWSMTLTYRPGEEPTSIRAVRDDAADFIKRLRKCARLFGTEIRYIYVIGAGPHRRHVHITVNALPDMAIFKGCWIHGHVSMTQLYSEGQYKDLAEYYMQNAIETKEQEIALGEKPGRMYVVSQNLTQPVIEKKVVHAKTFRETPKPVKGYHIEKDSIWYGITMFGYPAMEYSMRRINGHQDIHQHGRKSIQAGPVQGSLPDRSQPGGKRPGDKGRQLRTGRGHTKRSHA